jgi:hypothetical protein
MKNTLLFIALVSLFFATACSKRSQCPAYMEMSKGTLSLQDGGADDPDAIRKQSQDLLTKTITWL